MGIFVYSSICLLCFLVFVGQYASYWIFQTPSALAANTCMEMRQPNIDTKKFSFFDNVLVHLETSHHLVASVFGIPLVEDKNACLWKIRMHACKLVVTLITQHSVFIIENSALSNQHSALSTNIILIQ